MKKRRPTNNLVLVTGGAGFIGTNVVNNLIRHGYRVRVMDLLIPPTHNGKLPVWFNKKADFIKGDEESVLRNPLIAQNIYYSKEIEKLLNEGVSEKSDCNLCREAN